MEACELHGGWQFVYLLGHDLEEVVLVVLTWRVLHEVPRKQYHALLVHDSHELDRLLVLRDHNVLVI